MISENNRYSKYLDEAQIQVQMIDRSSVRPPEYAVQAGDNLDEIDDCLYSLDSDPRTARRPSQRNMESIEQPLKNEG